jgi:xanthine dehydrogenase accessory factor
VSGDDVLKQAITWAEDGYGLALATVISTWGSSPRPVGSQLAINDKGAFVGSVSGGCIESIVVSEAIDVIAEGGVQDLTYGVTDEEAREVRLTCGGNIRVLVERAPPLDELRKLAGNRQVTRVVNLSSGSSMIVDDEGATGTLVVGAETLGEIHCLHKQGAGGVIIREGENELFVAACIRPKTLVIVGAVHIAQFLSQMATAIGFEVTVIDSRPSFANSERLPGINVIRERTALAMQSVSIDAGTALVILAHDPILDDPALHTALASGAYYIGCLGSRRTHAKRLDRLRAAGFGEVDLERLHAPVGLDIGGRSAGEIAVAILAEIIAVGNGINGMQAR